MKTKKPQKFSVINEKEVVNGKTSIALAVISAALLAICIIVTILNSGEAPSYTGSIGLGAILLALYGCIISIKDLSERKNRMKITYFGAIFAGVMFLVWVTVILAGIKNW